MLLRSSNAKCIIVDNAEVDFLNPMQEFNDFDFYEPNRLAYIKDGIFIQTFLLNLGILILVIYILYYWIFLYIFFWRKIN